MNEHFEPFDFPDISDETVIAINDFLEQFYARFQDHYFPQIHRYYTDLHQQAQCSAPMPLPLDDPPR